MNNPLETLVRLGFSRPDAEQLILGISSGSDALITRSISHFSNDAAEALAEKKRTQAQETAAEAAKTAERERQLADLRKVEAQMNESMGTPLSQLGSLSDTDMHKILADAEVRSEQEQRAADLAEIEKQANQAMGF